MATVEIDGTRIAYEIIGEGRPWIITPGGRFTKEAPGVRELAEALAAQGQRAIIWDRPNTGESDVCFTGTSESEMQADALAGLLPALDTGPTIIIGGSGGSRVSLLAAARHPDIASKLAMWWISGGTFGLLTLAMVYCGEPFRAAYSDGMEAVADLPEWAEVQARNPRNRQRFLDQDRDEFLATMDRWMKVYCPDPSATVPGLTDATLTNLALPTLVFRSGASDPYHTHATSEGVHALIPGAQLAEPPWGDREWIEVSAATRAGTGALFEHWPLLAPQLLAWANAQ